jgi:hypothetical protein
VSRYLISADEMKNEITGSKVLRAHGSVKVTTAGRAISGKR